MKKRRIGTVENDIIQGFFEHKTRSATLRILSEKNDQDILQWFQTR